MATFDLPIEELHRYRPERHEPSDFDAFWQATLAETRARPLDLIVEPVDAGLASNETFDVTFTGFGGARIKGWFIVPRARSGPIPCVVEYIGYGGGRGLLVERLMWASAGFAHFVMDNRGQGSDGPPGATTDVGADVVSPHYPGFMTMGIQDPAAHYYRRLFSDAVRASMPSEHCPRWIPADSRPTAEARAVGFRWRWRASIRTCRCCSATSRSSAISGAPCRSSTRSRTRRWPIHQDPSRPRGAGLRDAGLLRRHEFRGPSPGPGAVLSRPHGRRDAALNGLRRLQPLRRTQGHPHLRVQRARGWRCPWCWSWL